MVGTTLPDNIGAAARAIKTMGGSRLTLVSPKDFPHAQATALAAGATDILEAATVVATLQEAIADSHLVLATSSRSRSIAWPLVSTRQAASVAYGSYLQHSTTATAAAAINISIVFGREDRGLTNDELALAHYHAYIPANEDYGVLNVAAAMQLFAYEMRMAVLTAEQQASNLEDDGRDTSVVSADASLPDTWLPASEAWVTSQQMEQFYGQLLDMLALIGFYDPANPRNMPLKLRRLFNRVRLNTMEYNLLRGLWQRSSDLAKLALAKGDNAKP